MEQQPRNEHHKQEYPPVHTTEFDISLTEASVDLFISVFSRAPWHDVFESKDAVMNFFHAFIRLPNFKGYQLIDNNNQVIGLSIGFIKPWLKNGELRYEYFLDQYCIDYTQQGKGFGKYFMREIEERLKSENINDIILNTDLSSPAYSFYIKTGFQDMREYGFLSKEL